MRRGGWRGALVVVLAMALVAALAPAGLAEKPDKPGKPGGGGGPNESPLVVDVVDVAGNLMFTVRPDDTVYFRVSLDEVPVSTGILVVETQNDLAELLLVEEGLFGPYALLDDDLGGESFAGSATYAGETASFEFQVFPREQDCSSVGLEKTENGFYGDFPDGVTCMLTLDRPGYMTVGLEASGESNKPTRVFLTMRDNIPGNWCAIDPESPSGFSGRVRPGEPVLLPSGDPMQWLFPESGICVKGGRGGDMIGDGYPGYPGEFYLVVTGELTLTWND